MKPPDASSSPCRMTSRLHTDPVASTPVREDPTGKPDITVARATADAGDVRYTVIIDVGGYAIVADEPKALGGQNTGPPPFGLLPAALGACTSGCMPSASNGR